MATDIYLSAGRTPATDITVINQAIVVLKGASGSAGMAVPVFKGALALGAIAKGSHKGRFAITGTVPLTLRGAGKASAVTSTSYSAALAIYGLAVSTTRVSIANLIAIFSSSAGMSSVSRTGADFGLAMIAKSTGVSLSLSSVIGDLVLTAQSAVVSAAHALFATEPLIFLATISGAVGKTAQAATAGFLELQSAGKSAGMVAITKLSGVIGFNAFGIGLGTAGVDSMFMAGLRGIGASVVEASVAVLGKGGLVSGLSRASSMAGAAIAGQLGLFGQGKAGGQGRLELNGLTGLLASSIGTAGAVVFGAVDVALVSFTRAVVAAQAAMSGLLGLFGQGQVGGTGQSTSSGAVDLQAGGMIAAAYERISGLFTAGLTAVGIQAGQGHASPIGKVILIAGGSLSAVAKLTVLTVTVGFDVVAKARAAGRAAIKGRLGLNGFGLVIGAASLVWAVKAALSARGPGRSKASVPVTGILTLTTSSSALGRSVARSTTHAALTAITSFGRSVANAFGLLFLKQALFVDPAYIVKYPKPVRTVSYAPGARMPRAETDFSSIYSTEQITLSFDFSEALSDVEVISNPIMSVSLVLGIDLNPSMILIGNPSITGPFVMQEVAGCQPGADYNLIARVDTTGGQELTMNAHLKCDRIE